MRVHELQPGEQFENPIFGGGTITYVGQFNHPLYGGLRLVVWRMPDASYSFDALAPAQELPFRKVVLTNEERRKSFRIAIGLEVKH